MTRKDLSPGAQLSQSCHACFEFSFKYPELTGEWHHNSNFIAILAAKNEDELINLIKRLEEKEIKFAYFRESDLDHQITAIAIEPGDKGKKVTSCFPLALKKCEEVK